jgi:hypothetical protein
MIHKNPEAYNIGKNYGEQVFKLVPEIKGKGKLEAFHKGFRDVGIASVNQGKKVKGVRMIGSGKRKTKKYFERVGRAIADDIVKTNPHLVGSGFFDDLWSGIQDAGNWIGKNIINPVANVVQTVAEPVADVASAAFPEFAPEIQEAKTLIKPMAKQVADWTGSGTYGLGKMYGGALLKEHPELNGSGVSQENFIQGLMEALRAVNKGSGKLHSTTSKRKARNELVKRVMGERNVSLPMASKIVKNEGLRY